MIIPFLNGNGQAINVDASTVEAALYGARGETVLRIGGLGVVVKGEPEEVAGKISKERGAPCPVQGEPRKAAAAPVAPSPAAKPKKAKKK
jgi:hypothetical protein